MHKTDAAIQLIRNALTAGIKAGYVLIGYLVYHRANA